MESNEEDLLNPTLQNLRDNTDLKWIFVGGKGGVGKTTTSCSIAVQMASVRNNVLIISTDPAHNLSDAFSQKFGQEPTLVGGFENLFCMEVDPSSIDWTKEANASSILSADGSPSSETGGGGGMFGNLMGSMSGLLESFPGIDEALSFTQLMKLIQTMDYDLIVFDTAPTGHTLRLMALPQTLDSAIGKMLELGSSVTSLMSSMMGGQDGGDSFLAQMDQMRTLMKQFQAQLQDARRTSFVCVCIPEFLSLYETERLVQSLSKLGISVENIVVNQILFPDKDVEDFEEWYATKDKEELGAIGCDIVNKMIARKKMQEKYIDQIFQLYEDDFHIVLMPILDQEIRGVEQISSFSELYFTDPEEAGEEKEG
jgi:arsenite-transporting ATPase